MIEKDKKKAFDDKNSKNPKEKTPKEKDPWKNAEVPKMKKSHRRIVKSGSKSGTPVPSTTIKKKSREENKKSKKKSRSDKAKKSKISASGSARKEPSKLGTPASSMTLDSKKTETPQSEHKSASGCEACDLIFDRKGMICQYDLASFAKIEFEVTKRKEAKNVVSNAPEALEPLPEFVVTVGSMDITTDPARTKSSSLSKKKKKKKAEKKSKSGPEVVSKSNAGMETRSKIGGTQKSKTKFETQKNSKSVIMIDMKSTNSKMDTGSLAKFQNKSKLETGSVQKTLSKVGTGSIQTTKSKLETGEAKKSKSKKGK